MISQGGNYVDKAISKISALGVPGLVFIVAVGAVGYSGAAAITTALVAIGLGGYSWWNYYIRSNRLNFRDSCKVWSRCCF